MQTLVLGGDLHGWKLELLLDRVKFEASLGNVGDGCRTGPKTDMVCTVGHVHKTGSW